MELVNRPPAEERPRLVKIVIEFAKIGEIDILNERYQALFNIRSSWIEFNDSLTEYNPDLNWNPKLYIENVFQEPKQDIRYEMSRDSDGHLIVTEYREAKGYFWERFELESFPLDVQELGITIASKLGENQVYLEADSDYWSHLNSNTTQIFLEQQKWNLYQYIRIRESASYDTKKDDALLGIRNKTPKLVATCFCSRKVGYYIFNAYFLVFLITASALNMFSIDCKLTANRIHINSVLLLTSISFKWVVNRSLPPVSYLTSLDKYAITCIFYICLLTLWHAIVGSFWTREEACRVDKWVLLGFGCLLVLIHLALLGWFLSAFKEIKRIQLKEKQFIQKLIKKNRLCINE